MSDAVQMMTTTKVMIVRHYIGIYTELRARDSLLFHRSFEKISGVWGNV